MMISLSEAQKRALDKLSDGKWHSAYSLNERISTLSAMEKKGVVESRGRGAPGSFFSPATTIEFRKRAVRPKDLNNGA